MSKILAQDAWRAIIEFTHGRHIPHNAIHKVLMAHGKAEEESKQIEAQKAMGSMGERS